MQTSLSKRFQRAAIIGLALAALFTLAGCSTVRLAYGQGPQLAHWWLDGYLDFRSEQSPRVKAALEQWFAWHRDTQLGDYAELLASAQAQVMAPATAAQVCRWGDELRARLEPAVGHALPLIADLLPAVTPAQLAHLEARYARSNAEFRKEYLQPAPERRLKASIERAADRFESLYGRLDDEQQRLVAASVTTSPFDADMWFAEREARQRDVLSTLRQLVADRPEREPALMALRQLARRLEGASRPEARAYQERLNAYNCAFGARLHNVTTQRQRAYARDKLRGWEDDVRHLAAGRGRPSLAASAR